MDLAGLTPIQPRKAPAPRLEEAGLIFRRGRQERLQIIREKPLPFFREPVPRQITIIRTKISKAPKKLKRLEFEPSTQEFPRSTQRLRRSFGFLEEEAAFPLQRFVPRAARITTEFRVPRTASFAAFAAISGTGLRAGEKSALRSRQATFTAQSQFEKALQRVQQLDSTRLREQQRDASRAVQRVRSGLRTGTAFRTAFQQAQLQVQEQKVRSLFRTPRQLRAPRVPRSIRAPRGVVPTRLEEEEASRFRRTGKVQGFNAFVKEKPFSKKKFRLFLNKKKVFHF